METGKVLFASNTGCLYCKKYPKIQNLEFYVRQTLMELDLIIILEFENNKTNKACHSLKYSSATFWKTILKYNSYPIIP